MMTLKEKLDKYNKNRKIYTEKNYKEQFVYKILGNFKKRKGIEIGPDIYPIIKKHRSEVIYVDIIDKKNVDIIVEKDQYEKHFDKLSYVVASHVFEHLPNPIRWLKSIYNILDKNSRLILIIPDKRQCFDYRRKLTTVEDIISYDGDDYKESLKIDFYSNIVKYRDSGSWLGDIDESELVNFYDMNKSIELAKNSEDIHSMVFIPESFENIMLELIKLNYINFDKIEIYPTIGIEFISVFYKK